MSEDRELPSGIRTKRYRLTVFELLDALGYDWAEVEAGVLRITDSNGQLRYLGTPDAVREWIET